MIESLPEKDRNLAGQFLKDRNFDKLLEIVKSDIYKERKKEKSDEEYESDALANMNMLKAEIIYYIDRMGFYEPEDFIEYEEY